MSDITDEMVEAMRHRYEKWHGKAAPYGGWSERRHDQIATDLVAAVAPLIRAQALEEAAKVAEYAHMVPPDGGSPSDAEFQVAKNAAAAIRALKE